MPEPRPQEMSDGGHSIHHCRHTYASELLRASGGNLRIVQKQLGHAKVTTTQVYADVFDVEMQKAVERLYEDMAQGSSKNPSQAVTLRSLPPRRTLSSGHNTVRKDE